MDEENKKLLITLQLEKAHHFLRQADEMFSLKHWDLAANRYYYACYHAVQGLFIAKDIPIAEKHASVVNLFSLHFVKSGIVEPTLGSFLARMMQLRQKADYNCFYDIKEEELNDYVVLSKKLIDTIEKLIE